MKNGKTKKVDYLIIGAGQAGLLVKKHLAGRNTVILDHNPAGYKIGESIVTDYFAHPSMNELMPDIVKLPSYTRKIGSTFISKDSVAFFPLSKNDISFHISRHELEALMIDKWGIPVVRERVKSVDVATKTVVTDRTTYRVAKQIIDCSGPAMVVARSLRDVKQLWPVYSTWTYFDIARSEPARFWDAIAAKGVKYLRYSDIHTPGALEPMRSDDGWDPKTTTILTKLREGVWTWQISLNRASLLSFGAVSRHGEVSEKELLEIARTQAAPNYTLEARPLDPSSPYNRTHVRNNFAAKASKAATMDYILVADAFCFADPIYSVGVALAANEGIEVASLLNEGKGWTREKCDAYNAKYEALIERAVTAFNYWYSGALTSDGAAADEVQKKFLVGDAFQVNIAKHYGSILEDVQDVGRFKVGVESEVSKLLSLGDGGKLDGWSLEAAFRYSYGVRLNWKRPGREGVSISLVNDPEQKEAYLKAGPIRLMYYSSKQKDSGSGDAALKSLIAALAVKIRRSPKAWERLTLPSVRLTRNWER